MTVRYNPADEGWKVHDEDGFIGLVGPIWEKYDGEDLKFGFIAEEKHKNLRDVVQGGMIMTVLDRLMGATGRISTGRLPQATVQLDVHFLSPAHLGSFIEGRAKVLRCTRSLMFIEGSLTDGTRVVATARGVWKILKA